ncbi:MAG: iron-sulfur cluster assembly scaffold protein [Nevskiales bacterium]|nr:iron-sulfur cluster assembly scaffold protein [Nevskiales bacterium]
MPFDYSARVWDLFNQTPRSGCFTEGTALIGRASTPASRSALVLHIKMAGNRTIADARFQAYGCPTTIAVGAWLAGHVVGQDFRKLSELKAPAICQALEIPEERVHTALLGEDVVKSLLTQIHPGYRPA